MKRAVVIHWKTRKQHPIELFSNLKIVCETYPKYNYNTLNNYLSKNKIAYETEDIRIERIIVKTQPVNTRRMAMIGARVNRKTHKEEEQNLEFWLSRSVEERVEAVTRLRAQVLRKNQRLNKKVGHKRNLR
jgi:predicted NAD-dependent protein-ADP-ribosyltransferase YbiA (DUF1768 family)